MYTYLENRVKVIFLGDCKSGKTTLLDNYKNIQHDIYSPTIGVNFYGFFYDNIHYDCWDTSGNKMFQRILDIYLKNLDKVFIVIDISLSKEKINNSIKKWTNFVKKNKGQAHKYIIFSKIDKIDHKNLEDKKIYIQELHLDDYTLHYLNIKIRHNVEHYFNKNIFYTVKQPQKQEKDTCCCII